MFRLLERGPGPRACEEGEGRSERERMERDGWMDGWREGGREGGRGEGGGGGAGDWGEEWGGREKEGRAVVSVCAQGRGRACIRGGSVSICMCARLCLRVRVHV